MSAVPPRLIDRVDAVLFDLDGTLLNTAPDLVRSLHAVCVEEQNPKPEAELAARYVSTGAVGLVRLAFPEADDDTVDRLRWRLVEIYEASLCVDTAPYHGVIELLDQLNSSGIRWGIVTNKMRYLALPIVEQLGLAEFCGTLVGGDTAARSKPHPDPILHALNDLGVSAENAVYVGDAEKDILAGKAAGTHTIAVTWGYTPPGQNPHDWDADYTIEHPRDLLALGVRT